MSPTGLEDTGKRTDEMGIILYRAGGATILSCISMTVQPNLRSTAFLYK